MRRISSRATYWYKRIFPIFWLGILLLFIAVAVVVAVWSGERPSMPMLAIPAVMMLVGYLLMRWLVLDLVDEVLDDGDAIVIRNDGREQRVVLADIAAVDQALMVNPPRVTVMLRVSGPFGSRVTFCAPLRLLPFTTSAVVDDLARRAAAARGDC